MEGIGNEYILILCMRKINASHMRTYEMRPSRNITEEELSLKELEEASFECAYVIKTYVEYLPSKRIIPIIAVKRSQCKSCNTYTAVQF